MTRRIEPNHGRKSGSERRMPSGEAGGTTKRQVGQPLVIAKPDFNHKRNTGRPEFRGKRISVEEARNALVETYEFLRAKNGGREVGSETLIDGILPGKSVKSTLLVHRYLTEVISDFLKLNPEEKKELFILLTTSQPIELKLIRSKLDIIFEAVQTCVEAEKDARAIIGDSDVLRNALTVGYGRLQQTLRRRRKDPLEAPEFSYKKMTSDSGFQARSPTALEAGRALLQIYQFLQAKNKGMPVDSMTELANIPGHGRINAVQFGHVYMAEVIGDFLKLNREEREEVFRIIRGEQPQLLKPKLNQLKETSAALVAGAKSLTSVYNAGEALITMVSGFDMVLQLGEM